jgi:hypothetical protein
MSAWRGHALLFLWATRLLAAAGTLAALAVAPSSAAAADAPQWRIVSTTNPTNFVPGHTSEPQLVVVATNVGGAATDGSLVTLGDSLPSQYSATAITGYSAYRSGNGFNGKGFGESLMGCSTPPSLVCSYSRPVDPGDALIMTIRLGPVTSPIAEAANSASVSGGGAAEASVTEPLLTNETPAKFGPTPGSLLAATSTSQAGAHPNVTTAFTLNTSQANEAAGYPKDVRFDLPPGLIGSTVGMPRCPISRVIEQLRNPNGCPADAMVGTAIVTLSEGAESGFNQTLVVPIYNIAPGSGEPAAFAFNAYFFPARLDTSVSADGDYAVRVTAGGLAESAQTLSAQVTFWGVPADHSGPGADKSLYNLLGGGSFGGPNPSQQRVAFLTNPQQCSEPLSASMSTDSWSNPGAFISSEPASMGKLTGCAHLSLHSSFTMLPDTLEAGAPAGYSLDLNVPQNTDPDGLATPNVKGVRLTLPAGTVVSPSVAGGLSACPDTLFGLHSGVPGNCPREAQIGTVEVKTPPLRLPLQGELYVAEPRCAPCTPEDAHAGRMVRLFLQVLGEGESPILVKLEGSGSIDQRTGQIKTTFENNPQLPFDRLKLKLNGGPRAPLANPRTCGAVATSLDLTPWSSPFTSDSTPTHAFEINQGCFGAQFNPSFVAGTTNIQAGAYSPFTLSFGRTDRDEFLGGLETRVPPGLLGKLSAVTLCKEPQAAQGTCGPDSLIGHVQVLTGPGSNPLLVTGGQVFLTDPYKGAPFGLSILVPAVAGPYTLAGTTGKGTVVVRASVNVDATDAHLTVRSDPLPTTLDGVPLQLKVVGATIDRTEFTFNPTNCTKLAVTGTLSSSEHASAAVSSPFQVANCATLPFTPKFTVLTQARTSKTNGASLHVKVASGPGQANIAKVKVDLPRQLPSRLTTLQKACPDAKFNANPASCPAGSLVGTAVAHTPILKNPLTGPAYLVSHAAAAFPDLEIVLQGEGITLVLDGNTDIKKGITSSTFATVPDAPISTFDLVLPGGPHSALGSNLPVRAKWSLCGQGLAMPTAITGQNGAVIKQTTKIDVSGCPKHKARKAKFTKHPKSRRKHR